jgi:hypothetical protein
MNFVAKTSARSLQYDIENCTGQADGVSPATSSSASAVAAAATISAKAATRSAATGAASLFARARFIHVQGAAVDILAVQLGNRAIGSRVVIHFHEAKATGLTGRTIGHETDAIDLPVGGEHALDLLFGRVERQVSHVQSLHFVFSSTGFKSSK